MYSFVQFLFINKIQQYTRTKDREHNGFVSHWEVWKTIQVTYFGIVFYLVLKNLGLYN